MTDPKKSENKSEVFQSSLVTGLTALTFLTLLVVTGVDALNHPEGKSKLRDTSWVLTDFASDPTPTPYLYENGYTITPTPIIASCTDSDSIQEGLETESTFTKGSTTATDTNGIFSTQVDSCYDTRMLTEQTCYSISGSTERLFTAYSTPCAKGCVDGACIR
jgi:hypothetical protein